jgi:hypothetical protein
MKVTESPLDQETINELMAFTEHALKLISLPQLASKSANEQSRLIESIDQAVFDWQESDEPPKSVDIDEDQIIYALGAAWGNAIVNKHQWHWADLTFHEFDDWLGRAVVSKDSSLMILPFAHIHECLGGSDEVKISMSLNVIGTDVIPIIEPKSYVNLIHNVQRIVPR